MFYAFTTAFVFARIGVNIVANFVSAAFDISNINPRRISFRTGGLITAVVSILVTPWNYFNNPVIVGYFLGSLGALLGPFFGILVLDYYLVRKQKFSIRHMYLPTPESIYYYNNGVSRYALYSLILSAIASLSVALVPAFSAIKDFGWFIGARLGGIIYYFMANNRVSVLPTDEKRTGPRRLATVRA
jgi:NCS1 family nucleobase:cation symporter-1